MTSDCQAIISRLQLSRLGHHTGGVQSKSESCIFRWVLMSLSSITGMRILWHVRSDFRFGHAIRGPSTGFKKPGTRAISLEFTKMCCEYSNEFLRNSSLRPGPRSAPSNATLDVLTEFGSQKGTIRSPGNYLQARLQELDTLPLG